MVITIKYLVKIGRKIIFAFLVLYGINVILNSVSFNIPINIPTVSIVSLLGVPGVITLIILKFMI